MKKTFLLLSCLAILPTYAACSIETGGACSIADVTNTQSQTVFSSQESIVKDFTDNRNQEMQSSNDAAKERELRNFGPQSSDYSYNTNCQFGVCSMGGSPKLFLGR